MGAMSPADGWQPISRPARGTGADAFTLSPFARLARAHALSIAGDALVVLALADSLFFSLPTDEARWRVFGYLALTVAPFAVVAPLIGPALDRARGGRRWMVVGSNAIRAVVCLLMLDSLDSLMLFPLAFTVLVMGKGYGVARSALVPTVVRTDAELVEANSKLQLLSGIGGVVAAVPGLLAILIAGSRGALVLGALVFIAGTLAALRIPPTQVSTDPVDAVEKAELRGIGILLAASAMALIRGSVGFLTFLLAFDLRDGDNPTWHFGLVLALSAAGGVIGAGIAPALRRTTTEERMLMLVLGLMVATGLGTAYVGGVMAAAAMGAALAVAATVGKLAFDSLVQRDAPDANRGRSFARFETRFQLAWVIGAVVPVLVPIPAWMGYLVVAGATGFALFSYAAGQRAARRGQPRRPLSQVVRTELGRSAAPEPDPDPGPPAGAAPSGPYVNVPSGEPPLIPDPWGFRSGGPGRPVPDRPSPAASPPPPVGPPAPASPTVGDPARADPTATDPTATDPTATDPTATDPTATDPTATDPTATDPTAVDPTTVDRRADGTTDDADGPDVEDELDLRWSQDVPGARASDDPDRRPVDPTELQ
jgi:hypothetical protein